MIRIGCISDIHGSWDKIQEPRDIELLILAGDLCGNDNISSQRSELEKEISLLWTEFPKLSEILIVPGNHDYLLERVYRDPLETRNLLGPGVTLLVDSEYTYVSGLSGENIRIYGNPRTDLYSFAFSRLPGNFDITQIPENIDILVTHDAPRNYSLPCIKASQSWYGTDLPGSVALDVRVREIKPKYHVFGHIHYPCCLETLETIYLDVAGKMEVIDYAQY